MKTQRKRSATKLPRGYRPIAKAANQVSDSKLTKLYSRLDQTKPGSKESKQIADEIIDAIG